MNRGFWYAGNGMALQQRKIDCVGNNLANASTAGFKRDTALINTFDDQLALVMHRQRISGTFTHAYVDTSYTDLTQGFPEYTESPFDVAIIGDVYFNIAAYNGDTMLTRCGNWELDSEGYLALSHSGRILGENGEIYLGTKDFVIDVDGAIYIDGQMVDRLRLSYIDPKSDVTKFGANMFTAVNATDVPEGLRFDIIQGAIERSNIDWNYELAMLMNSNRLYEANSSMLKMMDNLIQGSNSLCKKV